MNLNTTQLGSKTQTQGKQTPLTPSALCLFGPVLLQLSFSMSKHVLFILYFLSYDSHDISYLEV